MLDNIRLIGELYKKKMLTERIMHTCINKFLGQNEDPNEEDIESLCILMSTIGEIIDHPKAKEHMDAYFDIMENLSNNMRLSFRVRFMLKDAIDLRRNKWQQRRKDEVHRDSAIKQNAQASRLQSSPIMSSSARRSTPNDLGQRNSPMLSSLNSKMGNFRGYPPQLRGYGNQGVRSDERQSYEARHNEWIDSPLWEGSNQIILELLRKINAMEECTQEIRENVKKKEMKIWSLLAIAWFVIVCFVDVTLIGAMFCVFFCCKYSCCAI